MDLDRHDARTSSGKGEQTREHLLDAALPLFAEHGFRGTPVRDIAAAAGTNVAAVNYHFGSKERLYHAAFQRLATRLNDTLLLAVRDVMEANDGSPSLEAVLEACALAWSDTTALPEVRMTNMLASRELAEPQLPAQFLFEVFLDPLERGLSEAFAAACPELGPGVIRTGVHLFLAQLSHLNKMQEHLAELGPERIPLLDPVVSTQQIVRFTMGGLRALAEADQTEDHR